MTKSTGAPRDPAEILAELHRLRDLDPPTHGGRVLAYVYDHGRPQLDELAAAATQAFLPVNGLDPTTFVSVAHLERELLGFTRSVLRGGEDVVGSVTSGGTESCWLAVKSARNTWRRRQCATSAATEAPLLIMPTTAHPAFRKAAQDLGVETAEVPVDVTTGLPAAAEIVDRVTAVAAQGRPPALVVLSAPNYPFGGIDPIAEVADGIAEYEVPIHVDACIGGWLLPWWPDFRGPAWDFSVPGVTSISTDLHKYGFAPKGASVVLYRGRPRHRAQYFATARWPGYPVVNPTVLGSRSVTAMAAAWAVTQALGSQGYEELVSTTAAATAKIRRGIATIPGLRLLGQPSAALLAVATDEEVPWRDRVDPFLLIDAVAQHGFVLQAQPALQQSDGSVLPRTAHLTITPASATIADELVKALVQAAEEVRGQLPPQPSPSLVSEVLASGLPDSISQVMTAVESLPAAQVEEALIEVLARIIDPTT